MFFNKKKFSYLLLAIALLTILFFGIRHYRYVSKRRKVLQPPTFIYKITHRDTTKKSFLLITPYQLSRWHDGQLLIMDRSGKVYFQRNVKGAPFCFRQWNLGGHRRYTYIVDDHKVFHIPYIGMAAGNVVILDSAMQEIKQIHLLPYNDIIINKNEGLDLHDFILLADEHYIAMAIYQKKVNNIPFELHPKPNIRVDVPIIQEVNNGKVVWQWDASNYSELYTASEEDNNFADTASKLDYLHINSIFIDPRDNNLICSFRQSNQIIKIDRKNGTILWKLGGRNSDFVLTPNQVFLKQHHATLTDSNNTLLIFDNGDTSRRRSSRIVEFQLDEDKKVVKNFKAFNIPEAFSLFMGSVEKRGDNYFIAGGTGNYLLEINSKTNEKVFEMLGNLALYRVYEVNDISGIPLSIDQPCISE